MMRRALFGAIIAAALSLPSSAQIPGMFQPLSLGGVCVVPISLGSGSDNTGTVSSRTFTTTRAIPAGALVVVGAGENSSNAVTVTGVSDGTNTYTQAGTNATTTNANYALFYKLNAAAVASGATVTVTFSGSSGAVSNFSGIAALVYDCPTVTFDTSGKASSNLATTVTAASGTLAQADELLIGFSGTESGSGTYSGATGFTNVGSVNPVTGLQPGVAIDYKIVAAVTSVNYAPTWSAVGAIGGIVAGFKR